MKNLVLLRHGESVWNAENRFTGWQDVDLSEKGREEAREAGQVLKKSGIQFQEVHTSVLRRALWTSWLCLDEMDRLWLPTVKTWRLNERHYGQLTGLNKAETAMRHGEEQVKIWRRSYDVSPPLLDPKDPRAPKFNPSYQSVPADQLPLGESLQDTVARVRPYWDGVFNQALHSAEGLLIVAHGNSLRALIQILEKMSQSEIMELNVPTGIPLHFHLDEISGGSSQAPSWKVVSKKYLGDETRVKEAIDKVKNQGKSK